MTVQFRAVARRALTSLLLAGSLAAPPADARDFASDAAAAGVPGGALGRIEDGRLAGVETYGDVTPDDRFLWGSMSKPVAAAVAHDLADEGRLDLDDSAAHLIPGAPDAPVRTLVNHTSGLEFGAELLDVDRPATTAAQVAAEHPAPATTPGPHRYSSLGYLYLQGVIEHASSSTYDAALRRSFPDTRIGGDAQTCRDVTEGHRLAGPWPVPLGGGFDGAGGAYGYTCGSIHDLAAVAERHLKQPEQTNLAPTGTPGTSYGDGWRVTDEPDGRTTHWHTGTVPGYFGAIHLDPHTRDGVVVLLDASGYLHEERLAAVTRAAYERATGRTPRPIPSGLLGVALTPALLVAAALMGLFAVVGSGRSRRALMTWVVALAAGIGLAAGAAVASGHPPRYFWLWEPGLVVGIAAVLLAIATGVATTSARLRRSPKQPGRGHAAPHRS